MSGNKKYREKLKKFLVQSATQNVSSTTDRPESTAEVVRQIPIKAADRSKGVSKPTRLVKDLSGSKFRWINEKLYTTTGKESLDLFNSNPEYFDIYHDGFRAQSKQWPVKPVDKIIQFLDNHELIKQKSASVAIADMGCGDAQIAQHFAQHPNVTVHSFDLVKNNEFVTVCDIANTGRGEEEFDFVIFCLALMGTNYFDFLVEANRILKMR